MHPKTAQKIFEDDDLIDINLLSQAHAEALKNFAEKLLNKTKDNPQQIVEVLNKHFWDLV
jgi:hypothetical protein